MALEKKSVHIRLNADQHQQLILLADLADKDIAELGALLLEKAIVGEFHAVQRSADRMKALGMIRD